MLSRLTPYGLSFLSSLCIMVLELVASKLVARHVGASLDVWTSVIGIMLGGICLGNVLGGRLADRYEPRSAIGPLYALGALMTISTLWMNAFVGMTPGLESLNWDLRTLVVVALNFLIPGTVLGMISPVVAKIAVEQTNRAGGAIGKIYFWGAVGSIVGTFLAGFYLMYYATTTAIVAIVAAGLAVLSALMMSGLGRLFALVSAALLIGGAFSRTGSMQIGAMLFDHLVIAGTASSVVLGVLGMAALGKARYPREAMEADEAFGSGMLDDARASGRSRLYDLAALAFIASLAFMAFEMVAGRLVTRHLGSSIYGWTSVIGVLLAGLSLGNFLGGMIADRVRTETQASWLFLAASIFTLCVLLMEAPPKWLVSNPIAYAKGADPEPLLGTTGSYLSEAITMRGYAWSTRVLLVVLAMFFVPSITLGTVSPVVAKLAVDRLRAAKRMGTAIGSVYAWGMVGSILGTFLTGFVLIDTLGTKGVILVLATLLALSATILGSVWHAAWAGIPLGLCLIAFTPGAWFEKQGIAWGIREEKGDPETRDNEIAYIDESDYYFIKVTNEQVDDPAPDGGPGQKRILVLDNLIHGYFIIGHPERLDYDYEQIYALVTHRHAKKRAEALKLKAPSEAPLKTLFLGGGAYCFPRHLKHVYPKVEAEVAEIDPAVTRANHTAMGLPQDTFVQTTWGDARQYVVKNKSTKKFDVIYGDAFNDFSVPWHLTTLEFNEMLAEMLEPDGVYMINIIDVYDGKETPEALRFGGFLGAWVKTAKKTFPHIYVFGTQSEPGSGLRETFVVVVSKQPLNLEKLGEEADDPEFFQDGKPFATSYYTKEHMDALEVRSRGIVLIDDYAPVENLLAPIAATRGDDD